MFLRRYNFTKSIHIFLVDFFYIFHPQVLVFWHMHFAIWNLRLRNRLWQVRDIDKVFFSNKNFKWNFRVTFWGIQNLSTKFHFSIPCENFHIVYVYFYVVFSWVSYEYLWIETRKKYLIYRLQFNLFISVSWTNTLNFLNWYVTYDRILF